MAAKNTPKTPQTRERVALPSTVSSEEAVWPGQSRNAANSGLRAQLAREVPDMEHGTTKRYLISGKREQTAFLNLFRSVVANVHKDKYGVQAVQQDNAVIVRLGDKVTRTRRAK